MNETGEIPEINSEIKIAQFLFTILETSNTKIDLVKLQVHDKD